MKLTKELLTNESDLWIYSPPVDFFIDKVVKNTPFSFVKINHGFYERVLSLCGSHYVKYSRQEIGEKYIPLSGFCGNKEKAERHRKGTAIAVNDFLDLLGSSNNLPPNFFLGVSDRGFGKSKGVNTKCHSLTNTPVKDIVNFMKFYLPLKDYELYRGTLWKDYHLDNSLTSFLKAIKNKNVLYFGSACQHAPVFLNKFEHVKIWPTAACAQYDYIKKRIRQEHNSIIFFCAGLAQCHVIKEMHLVNNNTLIDCGQALLPYILNSYHRRWARSESHTHPQD